MLIVNNEAYFLGENCQCEGRVLERLRMHTKVFSDLHGTNTDAYTQASP